MSWTGGCASHGSAQPTGPVAWSAPIQIRFPGAPDSEKIRQTLADRLGALGRQVFVDLPGNQLFERRGLMFSQHPQESRSSDDLELLKLTFVARALQRLANQTGEAFGILLLVRLLAVDTVRP